MAATAPCCTAVTSRSGPVKAQAQKPQPAPVVPRLKAAAVAGAAAALLAAVPAVQAADLALGAEVFNNNCGSAAAGSWCSAPGSSGSSSGSSSRDSSNGGANLPFLNGRSIGAPPLAGSGAAGSSSRAFGRPARPKGPPLQRRLLLRAQQPASLMLLQAACHMGGNNSVMPERTLRREAIEQYLDGGLTLEAIVYQVENGKGAMPAWEGRLSDDEIQAVAAYVLKQAEGNLW